MHSQINFLPYMKAIFSILVLLFQLIPLASQDILYAQNDWNSQMGTLQALMTVETWYDDEEVEPKEIYQVRSSADGKIRHGSYKLFHQTGRLSQEGSYKDGELHGEWKIYHPNGMLMQELNFIKGTKVGGFKTFYISNGALKEEGSFFRKEQGKTRKVCLT